MNRANPGGEQHGYLQTGVFLNGLIGECLEMREADIFRVSAALG